MISRLISIKSIIFTHILQCFVESRVKATQCGTNEGYNQLEYYMKIRKGNLMKIF